MRLFRMIVSIFVMLIAGLIGFFVGIRIDEAMGGAVLFSVIAGIACVIYTIENLYGDNVFEKCGINRDGAGEVGKPRYFNGKRHF